MRHWSALLLLFLPLLLQSAFGAEAELPEGYNEKCLKDSNQPYSKENYQDCTNSEAAEEGRTECCTVGGEKGCCKPTETGRMLKIAFGIIGVALGLGIIVYICTWCDRDTWPCIGRIEDAWRPKQHKLEESLICCRDRVERRRLEEEHRRKYAAKDGAEHDGEPDAFEEEDESPTSVDDTRRANLKLEAPEEFKAKVQDSWF
ncbi:hypothetical protein BOX15_Mlig032349g2 [Macrostomum lignano]|uniref:Uncharacterized protein n=1 Tax=Macrostomum lignano TaxID=282301 RepID=A0A267FXL7_9PLAT|nr:hypothetical protein BOX15_Mlig032349g2 [Macrostomum lignano]